MQDWQKVAKKVYPSLKPARPQQFVAFGDSVLIVLNEAPYVVVFQGRDLDKLANIAKIGAGAQKASVPLPEPPPV